MRNNIQTPTPAEIKSGTDNSTVWQLWLDGAADLVACWELPPHPNDLSQRVKQRKYLTDIRSGKFYGATEPGARQVLLKGYPAGAKLVTELAAKIEKAVPPPKSRRRTRRWGDEGDECSFERIQTGHDNVWQSTHRKLRSACGLIELVAPWGAGCGTGVEELQWNGAAALAVMDLLEKADFSVELCLVTSMCSSNDWGIIRVDLKQMGELVNLEQLAAVAVYPPAYRIYALNAFQLSPFGSGDGPSSHPHAEATLAWDDTNKPHRMWGYRPNVMTVVLRESISEGAAIANAKDAITAIHKLVDPEYNPELEAMQR